MNVLSGSRILCIGGLRARGTVTGVGSQVNGAGRLCDSTVNGTVLTIFDRRRLRTCLKQIRLITSAPGAVASHTILGRRVEGIEVTNFTASSRRGSLSIVYVKTTLIISGGLCNTFDIDAPGCHFSHRGAVTGILRAGGGLLTRLNGAGAFN